MTRKKARTPGPMAVAAILGVCGLALAYVVVRPLFVGPNRAGAGEHTPSSPTPPEPTPGGAPISTREESRREPEDAARNQDRTAGPAAEQPRRSQTNAATPGTPNQADRAGAAPGNPPTQPPSPSNSSSNPSHSPASTNPADSDPSPAGPDAPIRNPEPITVAPSQEVAAALRTADAERTANRPVAAREALLRALARPDLTEPDRARLRERIGALNEEIIFSPRVFAGDPFSGEYVVQGGDSLSRIVSRQGLGVDWRLIQRVNAMTTERIREGQRLKIVRGPFHAIVDKSDYRLDLYAGPPDEPSEWVYIRSFTVGLGEEDGTPVGEFIVKRNSRLINPVWVNPRTGERFEADDPANPIGERWIGVRGLGEYESITGIGIHGTIDPASIGQQKSMGCVRMLSGDVELIYELLAEEISHLSIQP